MPRCIPPILTILLFAGGAYAQPVPSPQKVADPAPAGVATIPVDLKPVWVGRPGKVPKGITCPTGTVPAVIGCVEELDAVKQVRLEWRRASALLASDGTGFWLMAGVTPTQGQAKAWCVPRPLPAVEEMDRSGAQLLTGSSDGGAPPVHTEAAPTVSRHTGISIGGWYSALLVGSNRLFHLAGAELRWEGKNVGVHVDVGGGANPKDKAAATVLVIKGGVEYIPHPAIVLDVQALFLQSGPRVQYLWEERLLGGSVGLDFRPIALGVSDTTIGKIISIFVREGGAATWGHEGVVKGKNILEVGGAVRYEF